MRNSSFYLYFYLNESCIKSQKKIFSVGAIYAISEIYKILKEVEQKNLSDFKERTWATLFKKYVPGILKNKR